MSDTVGVDAEREVVMASVKIRYTFLDGETIDVKVKVKASYPDAVAEARANAIATARDLHALTRVPQDDGAGE